MGGNTFSKEDVDEDTQIDNAKSKSHSKSVDVSASKSRSSNRELRIKSKDTSQKRITSKSTVGTSRKSSISKDAMTKENMNKPKSKCKTVNDEKRSNRDSSKEERDIFARIAAGETTTVVINPLPPNATVAQDNNKGHGHYLQKGRYRYSPGFEYIRNNANNKDGDNQKQQQQNKKSPDEAVSRKSQADDRKVKPSSSAEVISRPVKSKKSPVPSPCGSKSKRSSLKSKIEKREKSEKNSKSKASKRKSASSTGSGSKSLLLPPKDGLKAKSVLSGGKSSKTELHKSVKNANTKSTSIIKESGKSRSTDGKQYSSSSSKPKTADSGGN